MYSPRSRCRRSVRALALLRWTSRSLRQATYCGEPTATLLARQNASSSPLVSAGVGWPRSRHAARRGATSKSTAMPSLGGINCIRPSRHGSVLSLPGLTRQSIEIKATARSATELRPSFVIARSACDEAIHSFFTRLDGLLPPSLFELWRTGRFARNDDGCSSHPAPQRVADLVEHFGILDGRGHRPWIAVGDLLDGAAQNLSRARLRQAGDRDRELERPHRSQLFAHQSHDLLFDLGMVFGHAGLQHQEAAGHFALDRILHAEHRAFGDVGMRRQNLFHAAGGKPMAGDIDDVVGAAHHEDIAVLVLVARVRGFVIAGAFGEAGFPRAIVLLPHPRQP